VPDGRQSLHIMSDCLHVIFGWQAEGHRPHAHAFDVVEMHAASSGAKFFEFSLDVPLFHTSNVWRADLRIARTVRVVTGNASLENFSASSGGIRRA